MMTMAMAEEEAKQQGAATVTAHSAVEKKMSVATRGFAASTSSSS
jgi:hypothetical protein